VALILESCATETCEPRQVRKEAAVSKHFRVPQGRLSGANCLCNAYDGRSKLGVRPFIFALLLENISYYFL